jgi:RimJ/RimL family protein N-acetyltransferase
MVARPPPSSRRRDAEKDPRDIANVADSATSPDPTKPVAEPTLETDRLTLRPLSLRDAPTVAAGAGDPRVARYLLAVPSPYPPALAKAWVKDRLEWWKHGRGITLGIVRRDQPAALLGTVSLRRYARDRRAELGYWLTTNAWQRGFATEATRALVDFGFAHYKLARIYAYVLGGNAASERVLEKLGMQREGVKRQHVAKGKALHDIVVYGLLRDEWHT